MLEKNVHDNEAKDFTCIHPTSPQLIWQDGVFKLLFYTETYQKNAQQ